MQPSGGQLDLAPYYANKGDERVTHTLNGRQHWRQVGWLGLAHHKVYALDEDWTDDPAGVAPLWWLIEDELPPDDEVATINGGGP